MEHLRHEILSQFEPFTIDLFENEFQVLQRQQSLDHQINNREQQIQQPQIQRMEVEDISTNVNSSNTVIDISSDTTAEIINNNQQRSVQHSYSMIYSSFFNNFLEFNIQPIQDVNRKTNQSSIVIQNPLPQEIQEKILTEAYFSPRKKTPPQIVVREVDVQEKLIQEKLSMIGIKQLRYEQRIVMDQILQRKNLIVCLPTSGGKSLLYMLPALIFNKVVIVITPTIALRQDQVQQLQQLNINAFQLIKGTDITEISPKQLEVLSEASIVFVTPEKMTQPQVQEAILRLIQRDMITLIAIDECHLMLDWSMFRDAYTQIPRDLGLIKNGTGDKMPGVICLSATLNDIDISELKKVFLQSNLEFKDIVFSPLRQNLELNVYYHNANNEDKLRLVMQHLGQSNSSPKLPQLKTIIYARSKDKNDQIQQMLTTSGYVCNKYHNGIDAKQRENQMKQFKENPNGIISCTISFGMGINITDVRQVINFDLTGSINEMLQKMGRAGRNGQESRGIQLFTTRDIRFVYKLIIEDHKETMKAKKIMQLIEVYQLFHRQICIWGQLQKYYCGYNIPICCNNCCFCKQKAKQIVFIVNVQSIIKTIYNVVQTPLQYSMVVDEVLNQHDSYNFLSMNYEKKFLMLKYGSQWKIPLVQYIINEMILHNQLGVDDHGLITSKLKQPEKYFISMVAYSDS